jgi:hypothetical protein
MPKPDAVAICAFLPSLKLGVISFLARTKDARCNNACEDDDNRVKDDLNRFEFVHDMTPSQIS